MLCGFWGRREDSVLAGMVNQLDHRHTGEIRYLHGGQGLHLAWAADACSNSLCGAAADGDAYLALVGMPRHEAAATIEDHFDENFDEERTAALL